MPSHDESSRTSLASHAPWFKQHEDDSPPGGTRRWCHTVTGYGHERRVSLCASGMWWRCRRRPAKLSNRRAWNEQNVSWQLQRPTETQKICRDPNRSRDKFTASGWFCMEINWCHKVWPKMFYFSWKTKE